MNKLISILATFLKCIFILWIPVLLFEESFIYEYLGYIGAFIASIIATILCLIVYIKAYKKVSFNHYLYNIANAILLAITSVIFGYLFLYFIDIGIFHQCGGTGWECFLFGIEYLLIGFEYALLSIIILVIWLFVRLIKYIINKNKK